MDRILHALFVGGKNRYINSTLRTLFAPLPLHERKDLVSELLKMSDLNPQHNAMRLSMEEIKSLCFAWHEMQKNHPKLKKIIEETEFDSDEASYVNVDELECEEQSDFVVKF